MAVAVVNPLRVLPTDISLCDDDWQMAHQWRQQNFIRVPSNQHMYIRLLQLPAVIRSIRPSSRRQSKVPNTIA